MRTISTFTLILILHLHVIGQNHKTITGKIIDSETKEGLPFATLGFLNNFVGTVTNENGEFKFTFSEKIKDDSLNISFLGYKSKKYASSQIKPVMSIELTASSVSLSEFVVLPKPPEFYIQLAVREIPKNYAKEAYNTTSYYKESFAENGNYIKLDECVFKSYNKDTLNIDQLLLHKETTDPHELSFMQDQGKKRKNKAKISDQNTENEEDDSFINFGDFFGGPKLILSVGNINHKGAFIDSTYFKKFNYNFESPTRYNGKEVMVINFSSKSRIDKSKYEGKLYIDQSTNAFVAIEYTGNIRIPIALKPILFLAGISITNPDLKVKKIYQEQSNALWYPQSFQISIGLNITKKYMFKKNEQSKFDIKQHFNVNKININNVKTIEKLKQFDASKNDYKSQVYNDNNIKWNSINRIH